MIGTYAENKLMTEGIEIPKGNFSFLYDVTGDSVFYRSALEMEAALKTDFALSMKRLRDVYENFVLCEASLAAENSSPGKSRSACREEIKQNIARKQTSYKELADEIVERSGKDYTGVYKIWLKWAWNKGEEPRAGWQLEYLRDIYNLGSTYSHADPRPRKERHKLNEENCVDAVKSIHRMLCIYYGVSMPGFQLERAPFGAYYPIPPRERKALGLFRPEGRVEGIDSFYALSEMEDGLQYCIFSRVQDGLSDKERERHQETLRWLRGRKNRQDPTNILSLTEKNGSDKNFRYQVYELPSKPLPLSAEVLTSMDVENRLWTASGVCAGILSMHTYKTPLYHRDVWPGAFFLCRIEDSFKIYLAQFGLTKDTSGDMGVTMREQVEESDAKENRRYFTAPEVHAFGSEETDGWKWADIYSVGRLSIYILCGGVFPESGAEREAMESAGVPERVRGILMAAVSPDPKKRPELWEISDTMLGRR